VHIDLWITEARGARVEVAYEVYDEHPDEQRTRYAVAESTLVVYDLQAGRPRRLTDEDVARLESLRGEPVAFRSHRDRGRGTNVARATA
jgi:acyl-CoA thioester hydrolase